MDMTLDPAIERQFVDLTNDQLHLNLLTAALMEMQTKGVCRSQVLALESQCPTLVEGNYPLMSYTADFSKTNLSFAVEALADKVMEVVVNLVIKAIKLYYRISVFIIEKVTSIAFNIILNKVKGRKSTAWDEIKYGLFMSQSSRIMVDSYDANAKSAICELIERDPVAVMTDADFYRKMVEVSDNMEQIAKGMESALKEGQRALKSGDGALVARLQPALLGETLVPLKAIWTNKHLESYGDAMDHYLRGAPIMPDKRGIHDQRTQAITLIYNEAPAVVDLTADRLTLAKHMESTTRSSFSTTKRLEALFKRGILEREPSASAEAKYKAQVNATSETLADLARLAEGLTKQSAHGVNDKDVLLLAQAIQGGCTQLTRFARASTNLVMMQGIFNKARAQMVVAFDKAVEAVKQHEAEEAEKKAKAKEQNV